MVFLKKVLNCLEWDMVAPKMKHPQNSGFTLRMFCKSDPVYKDIVSWKPFFLSIFFFFFLTSFHITCDLRNKDGRAVIIPTEYPPCWIFFISCTSYFFLSCAMSHILSCIFACNFALLSVFLLTPFCYVFLVLNQFFIIRCCYFICTILQSFLYSNCDKPV